MAAHRYWKLNITTNGAGGSNCAVGELFGYAAGQDDQAFTGGVASASSTLGGFPASNAFDGNINTFWATATFVNPTWLKYDFGATAGNWRDIRQIGIYGRQDGFFNQNPTNFDFLWSDDDITYTSAFGAQVSPAFTAVGQFFQTASPGATFHERVGTAEVLTAVGMPTVQERLTLANVLVPITSFAQGLRASWAAGLVTVKSDDALRVTSAVALVAVKGRTANPKLRAWTFSLDGHDFYVLRLGTMGTLVYDLASGQWMDWDALNEIYWPVNCGFNWVDGQGVTDSSGNVFGSNVVVGDDTHPLLWILEPEQPYDQSPDGPLDPQQEYFFTRILQGQVPAVGREAIPCFAAWLTTDMGDPGYVGAGVKLEISDDAGASYLDMGTVTVTKGNNFPEIAWYSLGQITAPGRLFRITDDGAVARIDNMEMNDPDSK